MHGKKIRVAVAFAVVIGVLAWILITGFNQNMHYYITIDELKAMETTALAKNYRVKGHVVPGSIERRTDAAEVRFRMVENGQEMTVLYSNIPPDTFKDKAEVLVEGRYTEDGVFVAQHLMAKCPSKYESAEGYESGPYQDATGNGSEAAY